MTAAWQLASRDLSDLSRDCAASFASPDGANVRSHPAQCTCSEVRFLFFVHILDQ